MDGAVVEVRCGTGKVRRWLVVNGSWSFLHVRVRPGIHGRQGFFEFFFFLVRRGRMRGLFVGFLDTGS